MHERLTGDYEKLVLQHGVKVVLVQLLDVFHLSGYAAIYSEIYSNPALWDSVKQVWNTTNLNWKKVFTVVGAIRNDHKLTRGNYTRFAWKNRLRSKIADIGYDVDRYRIFGKKKQPSTPRLRALIDVGYDYQADLGDVFCLPTR